MSFLEELKKKKDKLNKTETIVTRVDGQRYIEGHDTVTHLSPNYGFIVDHKPDDIPVMITDYIYIGSQDCAQKSVLDNYNIKHVLSLGIKAETAADVDNKFVQCLDVPETDIKPILVDCLRYVHHIVGLEENILIHCNAGVSRTATIAIAYLMQYKLMSFEDAYKFVKEKRPSVQPNDGFKRQLKRFTPGNVIEYV